MIDVGAAMASPILAFDLNLTVFARSNITMIQDFEPLLRRCNSQARCEDLWCRIEPADS